MAHSYSIRRSKVGFAALIALTLSAPACAENSAQDSGPTPTENSVQVATAMTPPQNDGLPNPGMTITKGQTAIVITDPQNDFLSPDGVTWGVVGKSVTQNGTVENLETLFKTAAEVDMPVFVSPHYYFPHDHRWKFEGALETLMHSINMFDRSGELNLDKFEGSGADWLDLYKPYITNGKTVVTSPHKIYGPETNDLILQLRKAGISKVILAGMSSNLCTESHMRELIEQGFEVHVVTDATAGAITEHYDGYAASLTNFRFIANKIDNTTNTITAIRAAYK